MKNLILTIMAMFFVISCSDKTVDMHSGFENIRAGSVPLVAPVSDGFSRFMTAKKNNVGFVMDSRLGLIPSPFDNSHLLKQKIINISSDVELKNSTDPFYDLRALNRVTSVKNQGGCGSCWTFAAMASAESSLMPGEVNDFSENNLKNLHGFEWDPCAGGNFDMAAAYFMRWSGPANEVDDPYGESDPTSPSLTPVKHVKNALSVSSASISSIKEAIVAYGVVFADIYYDDAFLNGVTNAYYYSGTNDINHAIAIVGWDDNYSKTNFNSVPANNGAWIIKNSWGTTWGLSGYFYISYEDSKINNDCYVYETADIEYDNLYSYDPLGRIGSGGYLDENVWLANVFTASSDEILKAVSFYANSHNTEYTVKIYTAPTTDPVTGGTLQATKSGTLSHAGYNTIVLDSPVSISSGTKFSVVIKVRTPGNAYPVPLEMSVADYANATASAGQSFITYDSAGNPGIWLDVHTGYESNANVNIKAYTDDSEPVEDEVLVINEIDYDQLSTDTAEFIELYNAGPDIADLSTYSIQLINGASGTSAIYKTITLPAVVLASGDYYVICGNTSNTVNCDLDVTPDIDLVQNGSPDAVALYRGAVLTDTISYEGSTVGVYTETTGFTGADSATFNIGISRYPDGADTDNNNADFSLRCITPGAVNIVKSSDCLCGNGVVDAAAGEQCEPVQGSCCTSSCKFAVVDTVCTAAADLCENDAKCTGASAVCPEVTEVICDDNDFCNGIETCDPASGCLSGTPINCDDSKPCTDDTCDPGTGECEHVNDDTNMCSDGNACTQMDVCDSGSCNGTNPVVCAAADQCHNAGTCNSGTGICTNPEKAENTPCDLDSDLCTQDKCQSGMCTAGSMLVCNDSKSCTDDTCNPGTGACQYVNDNSNSCTDGDGCTVGDSCNSGSCLSGAAANCDHICTNDEPGYICTCGSGYTLNVDGHTCDDIDECDLNTDNCDANATCANTTGSFTCTCNSGYSGSGTTCSDIDECDINTDNCDANATCSNTLGSFTCDCNFGFIGNGLTCNDIDECTDNTDTCDVNAVCSNVDGGYDCSCNSGYSGDGYTCSDIDECTDNTDSCDQTCTDSEGGFICSCDIGYELNVDGHTCDDIAECGNSILEPGEECETSDGSCCTNECVLVAFDTVCRTGVELCENDAKCDGISGICPANTAKSGLLCRDSSGECDVVEFCNGVDIDCPEDKFASEGSLCTGEGEEWTIYKCISGECVGETLVPDDDIDDSDDMADEDVVDNDSVDEDMIFIDEDTAMIDEDVVTVDEDTAVVDEDTAVVDEDIVVIDEDSAIIDEDATLIDKDSDQPDESNDFDPASSIGGGGCGCSTVL